MFLERKTVHYRKFCTFWGFQQKRPRTRTYYLRSSRCVPCESHGIVKRGIIIVSLTSTHLTDSSRRTVFPYITIFIYSLSHTHTHTHTRKHTPNILVCQGRRCDELFHKGLHGGGASVGFEGERGGGAPSTINLIGPPVYRFRDSACDSRPRRGPTCSEKAL